MSYRKVAVFGNFHATAMWRKVSRNAKCKVNWQFRQVTLINPTGARRYLAGLIFSCGGADAKKFVDVAK